MRWRSRRSVLSFDTWRTLVHERGLSQEQAVEVAARLTCEACSDPCAARQSAPAVPARRVTPPSSLGERLLAGLGAKASRREDGARARLISRNVATRNRPDINWDGTGSVRFSRNTCNRSKPASVCH
jgi:hypothetical protein